MTISEKESKMAKRAFVVMLLSVGLGCLGIYANAQQPLPVSNSCPYTSHSKSLACLIPDFTTNGQGNLSGFNTTVAQVLGELPLAAPVSGVVIGFNKKLAVPEDITENLGTILTERGNTVGKYKLFAGFTYQRFVFNTVDGTKLSDLPIVFSKPATSAADQIVGYAHNTLSANVSQYTGILAFGLTDRIDVSAILPFQRVSLAAGYTSAFEASVPGTGGTPTQAKYCPGGLCSNSATAFSGRTVAGSASGIGDLILVVKATAYNGERSKLAAGIETRFPTGDVFNLLGTGAYGFKPYVVYSYFWGRITPHANFGYQWNSFSVLRLSPDGASLRLPDTLDYSAGADLGLVPRKLSIVADLVGQHFFNAPRISPARAVVPGAPIGASNGLPNCTTNICVPDTTPISGSPSTFTSIGVTTASYNVENMSLGLKFSPKGNLIISANALLKLNDAGLRSKFVPLVGISYRFGR
jgi:hypothetical protein